MNACIITVAIKRPSQGRVIGPVEILSQRKNWVRNEEFRGTVGDEDLWDCTVAGGLQAYFKSLCKLTDGVRVVSDGCAKERTAQRSSAS